MSTPSNGKCHRCGHPLRDTTMPEGEVWQMRHNIGPDQWVVRSADMAGCPVLWCDPCGVGITTEDADDFFVNKRRELFSDLIREKQP